EDANEPDQHLQRALDAQPNHPLGSNPEAAQMMRQLVGAGIERRIAQALLAEHHRDRLGTARRLGTEQLRQGRKRERPRGVVPVAQQRLPLRSVQNVEPTDRAIGLRYRSLQEPKESPLILSEIVGREKLRIAIEVNA